jgi:xanthine dehydrogenase accessory factor
MRNSSIDFLTARGAPFAVILGTNEIASAIAVRLCWDDYGVVLSHDPFPPVIRRGMAFHDALFEDRADVDGICGLRGDSALEILEVLALPGRVAVTALPLTDLITLRTPQLVIDARMQKHRVTPDLRGVAALALGVGPRFVVDGNCDVAIETHPARVGAVLKAGRTEDPDGVARELGGVGKARFVYAPADGLWRTALDIGARVFKGFVLGNHGGQAVLAPMDGYLRGIARDGAYAPARSKLIEIDPRGRAAGWTGTDERGRAIAEAVGEAIHANAGRLGARLAATLPGAH